jgi:hypothetical protein
VQSFFHNSLKPFDCPLGSRVAIERDKLEMVFANNELEKKVNKNSNLVIMNNSKVWGKQQHTKAFRQDSQQRRHIFQLPFA